MILRNGKLYYEGIRSILKKENIILSKNNIYIYLIKKFFNYILYNYFIVVI